MTTGRLRSRKYSLRAPTVGVRTGASFVRTGETGIVVDRLPPGRQCAESDEDVGALAVFMEAIEEAQAMDRHSVRDRAAEQFDSDQIVDLLLAELEKLRDSSAAVQPA